VCFGSPVIPVSPPTRLFSPKAGRLYDRSTPAQIEWHHGRDEHHTCPERGSRFCCAGRCLRLSARGGPNRARGVASAQRRRQPSPSRPRSPTGGLTQHINDCLHAPLAVAVIRGSDRAPSESSRSWTVLREHGPVIRGVSARAAGFRRVAGSARGRSTVRDVGCRANGGIQRAHRGTTGRAPESPCDLQGFIRG
jgi:hypothetical protein